MWLIHSRSKETVDIFILEMETVVFSETLTTPYETEWCHSPERRRSQLRHEFTFEARSWHIRFSDSSSNSGTVVLLLSNGSAKYTGIQSRGSMFCSFSIHWHILMLLSIEGTWPIVFPMETVWFLPLNILNFLPSFLRVVSFISLVFCLLMYAELLTAV